MVDFLTKTFKLKENGTTVRTELLAGLTTFMTMAYILAVNPTLLSKTGMDAGAVFLATAIGSAVGTILMAVLAKYPFAMAPGMGLNAFFTFSVCGIMGYSWKVALAAVFVEGLIFVAMTLTGLREAMFNCIPFNLKMGVTAGIGMFIAFIGMQSAHLVVDGATLVTVYPVKASLATGAFWSTGVGAILCVIGVLVTVAMMARKIPCSILWGIPITWILGMLCETVGIYVPNPELGMFSTYPHFSLASIPSLSPTFMEFDFSQIGSINFWTVVLAFMFVDLFDTLGTLMGVAAKGNMLDKDGKLPNIKGAMLSDALGTAIGAVLGTSTVSTYVESSSGVMAGGRTGLTAITVAALFLCSIVLAPIFLAIPGFATAPALIVVGFMMVSSLKAIDFDDVFEAFPAYMAAITMALMYSISEGIACGVISYVVIQLVTGEFRKKNISVVMYILAIVFTLKYFYV